MQDAKEIAQETQPILMPQVQTLKILLNVFVILTLTGTHTHQDANVTVPINPMEMPQE